MRISPPATVASSEINSTQALAAFACATDWGNLPPAVQHEARRALVNWVGCAIGGSKHPAAHLAARAFGCLSTEKRCSVLGTDLQLDLQGAALVNGLSASAYAFDDTHLATVAHPGAPTVAALLAQAEVHCTTGKSLLNAIIVSNEIQCRISLAMAPQPAQSHLGLYMTGMTGACGVAAGVGKLIGLSPSQMTWAIGLGAMQAAGLRASHGNMCSSFIPGNAGRNGLLSAYLARENFTSSDDALGAKNGFLEVYCRPSNTAALLQDLGQRFECLNVVAKPFPAGIFTHAAIDAALRCRQKHSIDPDQIEHIHVQVNELGIGLTGRVRPKDAFEAQISVYHWVAAALLQGCAGIEEAEDAFVCNPRLIALRDRITVTAASHLLGDEAEISIQMKDGQTHTTGVSPCIGSARRPMTDAEISAKFLRQTSTCLGPETAKRLLTRCWAIDEAENAAAFLLRH